jgi:hypothetical protein
MTRHCLRPRDWRYFEWRRRFLRVCRQAGNAALASRCGRRLLAFIRSLHLFAMSRTTARTPSAPGCPGASDSDADASGCPSEPFVATQARPRARHRCDVRRACGGGGAGGAAKQRMLDAGAGSEYVAAAGRRRVQQVS